MTYRSYRLTDQQKQYLVDQLRSSNGKQIAQVAEKLGIKHRRYVWILYQRITGKTFSEDGYGDAARWRAMRGDSAGAVSTEILPAKGHRGRSRIPKDMKPCPRCEILIPVTQPQCEDCGKPLVRYQEFDPNNPYRSPLGRVYRPQ